ncbi:MAG: bifunctional glycosyltransferase/CDP-glycerol:glycerophosphate glycerophosphotransferase [Nocardioides sp.]
MHSDRRLRQAVRSAERRLPWSVRRLVRQARRPEERRSSMVTAVVAASTADAAWLGSCLDSLRGQSHRNLEILVVLHGPGGGPLQVAQGHAHADWRVRLVPAEGLGQGAARNLGAERARGRYVCFVGAKDVVPPAGIRSLVESLDSTGSDVAIGRAVTLPMPRSVEAAPDPAHDDYRRATTLDDFPLAVADLGTGNRLFSTAFWRASGLEFPEQTTAGVRPLAIDAFVSSSRFDMLPEVTYHEMTRGQGVPFGTMQDAMSDLAGWLTDQKTTWATLGGVEAAAVRDALAYVVCDDWAIRFIDDAERASDEQWQDLRAFLHSVVDVMDPKMWARVRAECKVKVWLVTADRRPELEEFLSARWFELGNRPTEVVDGEVRALLPYYGDPEVGVPDSCFVMSEHETALSSVLRGVRWDGGHLELDLFTWIAFVASGEEKPLVEVEAVCAATGRRVPLEVTQYADPEVTVAAGHRYQDYAQGALTARLDVAALARDAAPRPETSDRAFLHADSLAEWRLELRVVAQGVERRGTITRRDERGTAGILFAPILGARHEADRRLQVIPDPRAGIRVVSLPPMDARLEKAKVNGRRVRGTVATVLEDAVSVVATRVDGVQAKAKLTPADDGRLEFKLNLPETPVAEGANPRVWRLRLLDRSRTEHPLAFGTPGSEDLWLGEGPESDVLVGRTGSGACEIVESRRTVVLESLAVEDDRWVVGGRWPGRVPAQWTARLRNKRVTLEADRPTVESQRFQASIPTTFDEWGLGATRIPSGFYFLDVLQSEGREPVQVRMVLDRAMAARLLANEEREEFRAKRICQGRETGVRLAAPLQADERGPFAQKALQEWHRTCDLPIDEQAVYLQSYTGVAATDSQRAIHEELRRTRPELTLYWGVADTSTEVPEGAVPLLIQSREWYRVLATAKYLCNNIDFDRWFTKRPGQQFLQTFHGYPAKSMGIRLWSAKQFTPRRIRAELARTSDDWDLILTPAPEMDVHYRTEYAYDGPIESAGYPRDDALLAPSADEARRAARERLGVSPDATVVLYAPTWRDDQATSYRSAAIVRHLDLESATERLGEEYVFLMRGHRFHARGARRSGRTARLIDVTDYPEINDLILAADAAVLDYSSLRFDFALTGRPMLFLVPDLPTYVGGVRGFLYPFEESAPGPLIDDAEQVVERLRDLDRVRVEYADAYEQFNKRFNYLQDGRAAERVVKRFFR